MAITNFQQLDSNKIKEAYKAGYTQTDVQDRLKKKGLLPKQDISDKTFSGTNGTTGVNNVGGTPASSFKQAQGYKEGQVGMEGINLYKGVTPKADITTQPSEGKTDTTTGVTPKTDTTTTSTTPTTTVQPTEIDTTDMNALDDKITELQKKVSSGQIAADELAQTERQIKYYESVKRDQEYLQSQRDRQKEYDEITGEIQDIQSSQRLRQASDSLQAMKQNIAYLGNMGRPGQSSVKLDAIDKQIQEGNKIYSELVTIEGKYKAARRLGEEGKAAEFERKMDDIQRDLDDNVNKTLQDALGEINKAEMDGILRSPEDMEKFKEILFQNVDMTVAEISDRQWRKMSDLMNIYQDDINRRKEYNANKSNIKTIPNAAGGFDYMDANGDYLIDSTGKRISDPAESPIDPIIDMNKGIMVTFSTDEMGNIIPQTHQLLDQPTFAEQTVQNYASLVAQGKIGYDDVPESIRSSEGFINALTEAPMAETYGADRYKVVGNQIFDTATGKYVTEEEAQQQMQEGIDYSTLDFSTNQDLINKYPNEAAFKNNNPTGLTWGISSNLKNLFNEAGIQYSMGSPRSEAEGGNYIKFASVEDGLAAYQIALTQAGSDNVYNRLATWVGTTDDATNDRYAKDLMALAGIPQGAKFSELKATQLGLLMDAQLQRESPNFYNELMGYEQQIGEKVTPEELVQFDLAEGMTGNAKVSFLQEQELFDKYINYQKELEDKKDKYRDYYNEYVSGIKLGVGVSDQDREYIMSEFMNGLKNEDVGTMQNAIWRGVISKNEDNKEVYDSYKATIKNVADIKTAYNKYIAKGGDTDIFTGTLESVARKLGTTTDEDLVAIKAGIDGLLASYIKDISGTGVSDNERAFITQILPSIKNTKSLNDVLTQTFLKRVRNAAEAPVRSTVVNDKIYNDVFKKHFIIREKNGIPTTVYDDEKSKGNIEGTQNITANSSDVDIMNYLKGDTQGNVNITSDSSDEEILNYLSQ